MPTVIASELSYYFEWLYKGFLRYIQNENKCPPELDGKPCGDTPQDGGMPKCGCLLEMLSWCAKKDEPPKPPEFRLRLVP